MKISRIHKLQNFQRSMILILFYQFFTLGFLPNESLAQRKQSPTEDQIQFSYSTSDGGFQLKCTHWPATTSTSDWQVICGKGTPTVKEFFVHLYIDQIATTEQTKYIVYYSIHDRNHQKTQFSSHFTLFRFSNNAQFESFEQALSIENDAAYLNLSFKK